MPKDLRGLGHDLILAKTKGRISCSNAMNMDRKANHFWMGQGQLTLSQILGCGLNVAIEFVHHQVICL